MVAPGVQNVGLPKARQREPTSASVIAAFAVLVFSVFACTGHRKISSTVNFENVEDYVRSWIDSYGLTVQNLPSQDTYFSVLVTKQNGNRIRIGRWKEREKYIVLQGTIVPSEQERVLLGRLSKDQAEQLRDELVAEMTRAQIIRTGINLPFGNVVLEKRVPISGLTEDVFIRQLDELDSVMLLFRNDVSMALRRNKLIP